MKDGLYFIQLVDCRRDAPYLFRGNTAHLKDSIEDFPVVQLMGKHRFRLGDLRTEGGGTYLYCELPNLELGQNRSKETDDLCVWDHGIP